MWTIVFFVSLPFQNVPAIWPQNYQGKLMWPVVGVGGHGLHQLELCFRGVGRRRTNTGEMGDYKENRCKEMWVEGR